MPITKQAIKKMRSDRGRSRRNAKVRERVGNAIKLVRKSPNAKNLTRAFSLLDKATKGRVYHPNTSARLKSRLSKLVSKK